MAGPSVMVRVLGDVSGLGASMKTVGASAATAAASAHDAFSGLLGTLNRTGVLGPFGESFAAVDEAIGHVIEHGKAIGPAMLGVGGALVGVGAGLQALGSKDQAAHQQLQASVAATGQSYDDYASRVDEAIKHQEKFGDSSAQTQDALSKLTEATHDPAKALDLLGTATDVAAAKHESLTQAASDVGKVYNGNTKLLKEFGVVIPASTKGATDHTAALQALANVTKGQADAATQTFTGRLDALKTKVEDSAAAFGQKYGPALTGAGAAMSALGAVWQTATGIKEALTAATDAGAAADDAAAVSEGIALGPILLIIGAVALLAVGVYELWKNWSTVWGFVKSIIKDVWDWISANWPLLLGILLGPIALAAALIYKNWSTIKAGAKEVVDFITGAWNGLVSFFTGLPGRLAGIWATVWGGMKDAFRAVLNGMIDLWNALHFTLPKIDLGPLGKIGGGDIGVPHIPHLAEGGLITETGLIFAHAGEAITPAGKTVGPAVHIENASFNNQADVDMLMRQAEFAVSAGRL